MALGIIIRSALVRPQGFGVVECCELSGFPSSSPDAVAAEANSDKCESNEDREDRYDGGSDHAEFGGSRIGRGFVAGG